MITLVNPKINGRQTSGTYNIPEDSVYFMFGNASKTTIECDFGQFYVADDIADYNSGFKQLVPGTMIYGGRNITSAIKLMNVYVNNATYIGCYARLDNSNAITVSYTANEGSTKAIFKLTHELSDVVLYQNSGYETDDFSDGDMDFTEALTQTSTKSVITGYMGGIVCNIKIIDELDNVTIDTIDISLGGGTPATVLFKWGAIVCKGVVGVGSVPYYISPARNTIAQSSTNRTFMYDGDFVLENTTSNYIEYYVRGNPSLKIYYP